MTRLKFAKRVPIMHHLSPQPPSCPRLYAHSLTPLTPAVPYLQLENGVVQPVAVNGGNLVCLAASAGYVRVRGRRPVGFDE